MDNNAIKGLLIYEPPWRGQLIKWREKRKTLLSSVAFAAAPLEVEPGQDIGGDQVCVCVCVCERERERGREGRRESDSKDISILLFLAVAFTDMERDQLKELPNRDCILHHLTISINFYSSSSTVSITSLTHPLSVLLDKAMKRSLYLGLVDIIFAFAYDHRTTLGENSVRSNVDEVLSSAGL